MKSNFEKHVFFLEFLNYCKLMPSRYKVKITDMKGYKKKWMKAHQKEYKEKYRECFSKYGAKKRGLGWFILFENPFSSEVPIAYHHVNDIVVVPVPLKVHRKLNGKSKSKNHRQKMNEWIEKYYGFSIELLLNDEFCKYSKKHDDARKLSFGKFLEFRKSKNLRSK